MANVNANINVNIQTQQAAAQLRKLSADISRFNQQTFAANSAAAQQQRALNQALIDGVRTSGHFRTSIVPMTSAVENFSNSIEKGKLSLGQYTRYAASQLPGMRRIFTREFDMISRVAEMRVRKLNTQFVALGESANGMRTALAMTPTALDQFAARSAIALQRQQIFNRLLRDGSTQLLNWGKNTQWAGRQLMVGFTIPLGLLGAQAAKVFRELEAEAINFKKVYGDMFTTDVEVEKNLAAIKELSMEMTKYGQTAQQTMQLANTAAQSGARGAELMAATRQATRLAILGQMEQNQAIETTISLQTAFSLSNEQLAESINFLNSVENQTILSLQDVSEAIPRVASVIKGFGGDVEDLSVLLVAMKEGGVSAAEGANALKNSMARVIAPTKRALETSAKYGIALQDIVARNEGKVVPLFQELARALEAVGGQERQEILSDIFGKFQYARIGTLLSNIAKDGSQAAKAIELTGVASRDLAATAERELSAVEDAVGTKFTAALEKAKVALAPVGEEFLKALTPVLESVGKILGKFDELPGGIKTAIVAATAIIGGIAPIVLMVTGLVANGIANIAKFILFLRKQIATLRGNGEQFKMYTSAELEAAAAAASLEGKTSSLTKTMLLQRPAIETLITLYNRLATSARTAAAAMPTTMGGVGVPFVGPRGGGFRSVAPPLPVAYRNTGGEIFESASGQTRVPGSGNTDTVPAMLTPGEFVINKKATQQNLPLIKAINDGQINIQSGPASIPTISPQTQQARLGAFIAGFRLMGKNVGAHASNQVLLSGKDRLSFLAGAERALAQSNKNARVYGLDRTMLNIDDAFNQAMKRGGKGVVDRRGFSQYIRNEPNLFNNMPEIQKLSKTTQNRFKSFIAQETRRLPAPIDDFKFAQAYENAVKRMQASLSGNPNVLRQFNAAIESTRQLSQTRLVFGLPKGVTAKTYDGAEAARTAMRNQRLVTRVKSGEPFYYVDRRSRKLSAIVWNPDTQSYVSVTTDSTRKIAQSRLPAAGMNAGGEIQRFNTGGYVGSSSMYDPRYMRGSSGSQTVNRMNNYRQYVNARRNVKSTTSFSNRNRNLRRIRPPKPRTLLDYAIPRQSTFASVPVPMPHKERVRLPQPQDLTGRFVRDVPGTSVGSRYQYAAKPQTGIPFLDNLHERTGLKSYELVAAPPSVLRDKYGRSISREEYNKRERFRNVLRFESNQRIRQAMRQSEMARRENYRKGAAYRFGEEATRVKAPLYDGGKGVSSRLGQDRGRAELQRDRLLGIKPMMMKMPDTRDPREKVKSFKVRPGETIRLPNGEMYTNDSRSTKYITNPYYRKAPGSRWVNPQTMMPYDLGGQADVDLKNIFPTRRLAKSVEDANIPELARLGIPWAERMSQQVHRTGAFGVPGFNKGGMIPGVQYLWGGGIARYLMHPLRALRDRSASKAQIYFKGADMYPANMSDHRFQSTFIAYKKRKLLRDKAVGGITYQGSGGKYDVVPYNELFPGKMLVDPRGRGMSPTVQTMGVMPGYEYLAPQLLGLVGRQSLQRYGKMPLASSNLSVYSSKIVKLLVKRGIIKDPGFRDDFNEITRRGARGLIADMKNDLKMSHQSGIISKEEVSKSSRFVRSLLSSSRPKTQKEFEQLSLFKAPSPAPAKTSSPIIESIQKDFLRIINSPKGMQNSKEIGNLGSRLLRLQQTMGVTRESEELLLQIGRAFNRSKAMGLNKGGKVPKEFLKQSIKLNNGNTVPGVGNTDTVPAMLTPGEFVVNKQATQENLPLLHAINDGNVQKLNDGGVSSARSPMPGNVRQSQTKSASFAQQYRALERANASAAALLRAQIAEAQYAAEAARRAGFRGSNMVDRAHDVPWSGDGKKRFAKNPYSPVSGSPTSWRPQSSAENQWARTLSDDVKKQQKERDNAAKERAALRRAMKDSGQSSKSVEKIMSKVEKGVRLQYGETQAVAKGINVMMNDQEKYLKGMDKNQRNSVIERSRQFAAAAQARKEFRTGSTPEARTARAGGAFRTWMTGTGTQIPKPPTYAPRPGKTFAQSTSPQALARQIKMQNPGMTSSQALAEARRQLGGAGGGGGRTPTFLGMPGMGDPDGPGIRPQQSRMQRMSAGIGRFGMGAGMGLSMAGMIPMMAADKETGKFMGMDAGTAMMGMMGAGTLLSLAPMMGAAAAPVLAVAGVLGALAITAKLLNDRMAETAKRAAEFGANVGGTANALNTISSLFGEKTPAQRSTQMQLQFSAEEQEQSFGEFQNYLGSELGQKFIKDFENLTGADRFKKLSDYIRNGIAAGVFDNQQAIRFAKTIGSALNDAVLGSSVIADLRKNVQETGSEGLLSLAQRRESAVAENEKITVGSSEMVGSSIQIIQDYGNALALANEEFAQGTISYEEFSKVASEAKRAQDIYSESLLNTLAYGPDGSGQGGELRYTLNQAAIAFNNEMQKILTKEQMDAMKKATESGSISQLWGNIGPGLGGRDATAFEGIAKAEIGAAIAMGMDPNQAISIVQEIRDNPDTDMARIFAERAGEGNALAVAAFSETSDVMAETLGLSEEMNQSFKNLGITFLDAGGNIGEFQTFITNLPQRLRDSMVQSLQNMGPEATKRIVTGGTAIMGAYGERGSRVMQSDVYRQAQKGLETRRIRGRGRVVSVPSEEELQRFTNLQTKLTDLQEDFGTDSSLDLQVAINSLQNDSEINIDKWIRDASMLSRQVKETEENFPPEIYSQINIDFTDPKDIEMWNKSSQVFAQNIGTISQLNPNIDVSAVLRFLTLDSEGDKLSAEQVTANTIALNKAWKNLESSKNIDIRRQAMITIVSALQDENGNLLNPDDVTSGLERLEKQFGGKIYRLPPDLLYMSIKAIMDATSLREQAKKLTAAAGSMPADDPSTKAMLTGKAASLEAAANAIEGGAEGQVKAALSNLDGGGGGGGGGGGSQSPVQGFVENILNQFKMWVDAGAKMADLNNARTKFVDMVLKGDSIFNRLNKVKGIDPMRLQEILGMGPEGAQEFLDKYAKGGKLTKAGKGILDAAAAAGINETIGVAAIQATQTRQQTRAANILSGRGAGSGLIQQIAGDPRRSAELVRLQKEYNQAVKSGNDKEIEKADKALNKYIRSQGRAIQAEKDREEATKSAAQKAIDSNNDIIEANNKAMEEGDYYFQKEESRIIRSYRDRIKSAEDQIDSINKQIDAVNKLIDEQEKLNRSDQNRIRGLERQKEMLNRQLEELDRANELDGRRIETLQREDEIRGRVEEALSRELELMSRAEEDIRDSYQKRIDALDEVAKVNDYILNQQRQQLDLSRAISEGDIYAATAAAQEMRASSAGFAVDQVRQGLETGMENQIAGLRTSEGLTRGQAEERIRQIQDQSYQTSLQIRDIEDAIYNRNLQMIPIKDQIRNYDLQIRDIQDTIYNRESEILRIQTEQLEPLQTSLTTQQDILDNLNDQVDAEIEAITYNGMNAMQWADNKELIMDQNRSLEKTNEILQEEDERLAGISKKWENISKQIRQANRIAKEKITDIEVKAAADIAQIKSNTDLSDDEINEAVRKRTAKRLEDVAAAEQERQKKADKLLESGSNLGKFAGGLMKYAMGGIISNPSKFTSNESPPAQRRARGGAIFGNGSRDSIPAILTPGEFVVRKAMVDKYGIPMMESINQGSFSMPRYSMPENTGGMPIISTSNMTSISAPVYNTYDMKFSINGANQSADEIANKVMFKMKQLQNQQIRGNRGY